MSRAEGSHVLYITQTAPDGCLERSSSSPLGEEGSSSLPNGLGFVIITRLVGEFCFHLCHKPDLDRLRSDPMETWNMKSSLGPALSD